MTLAGAPAWRTAAGLLDLREPFHLGILNLTPDSFSDGGRYLEPGEAVAQARRLAEQGARALDLGAESTRPGAEPVTPEQEWARLEPALRRLREALPGLPLSLDTRHAEVARRGLALGVAAINDVTGFQDPDLLAVAASGACGLIAMRSRMDGGSFLMPPYGGPGPDTAEAAVAELAQVRDRVLAAGIAPDRILLDPGFGFGTTFQEDRALWEALPDLPAALDWPAWGFCLGISRKRFLAWRAGSPMLPPLERDPLGARAHHEAARLGYRAFRSHVATVPKIRPALPADAPAIAQVQVASWRATYQGILPEALLAGLSVAERTAGFRQALEAPAPGQALWVLEARGRLLGFCAAGPNRDGAGPAGEIQAIYLLREAWGQGLGRPLLARALAGLAEAGCPEARLWVLERNARARRFYEALGWVLATGGRTIWQDGIALRECPYRLPLAPPGDGL